MSLQLLPDQLKQGIATVIRALPMAVASAGFATENRVYVQQDLDVSGPLTVPCWVITTEDKETLLGGDSEWWQAIFPFRAWLLARRGTKDQAKDQQLRSWRHEVIYAFSQQRPLLEIVTGAYWCEVVPATTYKQDLAKYQLVESPLDVKCWARWRRNPNRPSGG